MTPKRGRWTWVTWITGLLSGDDACAWAAWAKSNFDYDKRPDENAEKLAKWKAEHADLMNARAAQLRAEGWIVRLEGQNSFKLKGRATTLSGQPDLVATKQPDITAPLEVLVSDGKTGERKGKDIWQVRIYQFALPLIDQFPRSAVIRGEVVYKDGIQSLGPIQQDEVDRIARQLGFIALGAPPRVPSPTECRFCNIAACPDRVEAAPEVATDAF